MSQINVTTIRNRTGGAPNLDQGIVVGAASTFSANVSVSSNARLLLNSTSPFGDDARNSYYSFLQVKGNTYSPNSDGRISLGTGVASGADTVTGTIYFNDVDGGDRAAIKGFSASAGGSANYPGYLTFSTNAGAANPTERMKITSNGGILLSNGILVERCKIVATAWSTTNDISLDDGNVFLNTANLGGTGTTIDITSSNGLNVDLETGDMTSVTLITAVNATTAFINHITIGAASVTESWVGGSAPTDGGGSGYDVYTFNIIKTGSATYVVIANQVKGS